MTTTANTWTADDLKAWRARLGWTQAQAAESTCYHLAAWKNLEGGKRTISSTLRRLCLLVERERTRSLVSLTGTAGHRQAFASEDRVLDHVRELRRTRPTAQRYVSLFSGLEAATAAMERIGADAAAVAYAEVDPVANAVLRHRWPDVPRTGDVTAFDWSRLRGHVDLVFGGSPCQSFSSAGKRLGIRDPRGNLALHYLRSVEAMQPEFFVYENVPGLLTSDHGDDFEVFLREVDAIGYSCAWRVLDAQDFGLPQRRKRLWIVGERGGSGHGPAEVLALQDGEDGCPAEGGARWSRRPRRTAGGTGTLTSVDWSDPASWAHAEDPEPPVPAPTPMPTSVQAADLRHCTLGDVASTLQVGPATGYSLNAMPVLLVDGLLRRLTPVEALRLQGFDDDWVDGVWVGGRPLTDSDVYGLAGNSWPVTVAAWILERLLALREADMAEAA